jgi:hypothetical protein
MLDVRDADTAKVADTVWTMPNFQHQQIDGTERV